MKKMGFSSRQTAYNYLNSLELKGKAYNEHGLWFPKEGKVRDPNLGSSVEEALRKLAEKKDEFSLEEVAGEVGSPPSGIEASIYRFVKKHDWETYRSSNGELMIRTYKHEPSFFVSKIPK